MVESRTQRTTAVVLIAVALVLTVGSLALPWYTYKESYSGTTVTEYYFLGTPSTNGTVQYSCTGSASCPSSTSYSNAGLSRTSEIAEYNFAVIFAGILAGLLGAYFGIRSRGDPLRLLVAFTVTAIALVLTLAGAGLFAAALPGASSHDYASSGHSGPWSSFAGSTSYTQLGTAVAATWGPATGWYLSLAATALFSIGAALFMWARRHPPAKPTAEPPEATVPESPPESQPILPPPPTPPEPKEDEDQVSWLWTRPAGAFKDSYNSSYTPLRQRNGWQGKPTSRHRLTSLNTKYPINRNNRY